MLKGLLLAFLLLSMVFSEDVATTTYPGQKFAGELEVAKSAPERINVTDQLTVTITLTNKGPEEVSAVVQEYLGNVIPLEPQPFYTDVENESELVVQPPLLSWNVSIAPDETETISYTVMPKTVGPIYLSSTEVYVPGGRFLSNPLSVMVECSGYPGCDERLGETPLSCPDKCGGDPNATVDAPQLEQIPSPDISETGKGPWPGQDSLLLYAGIAVAVLALVYLLFRRKRAGA
ncbi:MAG: hypothetical protein AB1529_05185 [Candidatus Micrarchaeota archaeon]